jgi:Undecaprenyl-phosphate galactose phosphotransferase WbaP
MNQARLRVFLLMVIDALTISAIWVILTYMWADFASVKVGLYIKTRGGFALVYLAFNTLLGLYHGNPMYPGMALPPVTEFKRLSFSTIATGLVFFSYLSVYAKTPIVPPWIVMLTAAINIVVAQSARNAVRLLMWNVNLTRIPVVLIGEPSLTKIMANEFKCNPHYGIGVSGIFVKTKDAVEFGAKNDVKHCVCCQSVIVFREAIWTLMGWFSDISWMREAKLFPIATTKPLEVNGLGGVEMSNQPLQRGMRAIKRFAEFVLTLFAFTLSLIPGLFIYLVLGISGGFKNVFYSAPRIGKKGRSFRIYKFRTMRIDADEKLEELLESDPGLRKEWNEKQKLENDPRITLIGKFLRKTSLDELPQFINIFRGEMSLIGPRPIVESEISNYADKFDIAFRVKPGITGFWQVSGRSCTDYDTRVRLDTYYSLNWSLWLDIWILLRTFAAVIKMRGAK